MEYESPAHAPRLPYRLGIHGTVWRFRLIKVPVFSKFAFFQLGTFFTQNFFPRCHLQKCWDVNNVYAFQKKAVSVVRIISDGGGGGLKKIGEIFDLVFLKLHYRYLDKKNVDIFFMNSFTIDCIFIILL